MPPFTQYDPPGARRLVKAGSLGLLLVVASWPAAMADEPKQKAIAPWRTLFDGKQLGPWEIVEKYDFKQHGQVHIKDGQMILDAGSPGTAIRLKEKFPATNYEVTLEAMRMKGNDFFCGMTFPVGPTALTLIVGGWGGSVTGLSNIDSEPAVENETCQYIDYEQGRWYHIRVRVTKPKVEVWLDDTKIIDFETADRELGVNWLVEPCLPFGIATWRTTGALRNIRVRSLAEERPAEPTTTYTP